MTTTQRIYIVQQIGCDRRFRGGLDQANMLLDALRKLLSTVRAMDAELDGDKPSEEQYQAALAQADGVIALATEAKEPT